MAEHFDEAELMDRVDNDVEFLAETVEMLTSDGPGLVAQVRDAIAAGDAAAVGRHAHALKGMISNFCAAQVQAGALEVEQMGKTGNLNAASSALAKLESLVEALGSELTEFVRARK